GVLLSRLQVGGRRSSPTTLIIVHVQAHRPARPGSCGAWAHRTRGHRREGRSAVAAGPVRRAVSQRGQMLEPRLARPRTSSRPSATAPRASAASASRDICARRPGACRSSADLTVQRVEAEVRDPFREVCPPTDTCRFLANSVRRYALSLRTTKSVLTTRVISIALKTSRL